MRVPRVSAPGIGVGEASLGAGFLMIAYALPPELIPKLVAGIAGVGLVVLGLATIYRAQVRPTAESRTKPALSPAPVATPGQTQDDVTRMFLRLRDEGRDLSERINEVPWEDRLKNLNFGADDLDVWLNRCHQMIWDRRPEKHPAFEAAVNEYPPPLDAPLVTVEIVALDTWRQRTQQIGRVLAVLDQIIATPRSPAQHHGVAAVGREITCYCGQRFATKVEFDAHHPGEE